MGRDKLVISGNLTVVKNTNFATRAQQPKKCGGKRSLSTNQPFHPKVSDHADVQRYVESNFHYFSRPSSPLSVAGFCEPHAPASGKRLLRHLRAVFHWRQVAAPEGVKRRFPPF
jgi:hypothetical protein